MINKKAVSLLAALCAFASAAQAEVWINEIHYDNGGADVGEAIEVAGDAGTDLNGWTLQLYNGSDSAVYATYDLGGSVPGTCGAYGVVSVNTPGLQNGSPDGIALVNGQGKLVQFLSYEGSIRGKSGPARRKWSTDIGVSESGSEPVGQSLQLAGSGTSYADFVWMPAYDESFGQCNPDQTFPGMDQPPTITGNSPADGATGVATNASLQIQFSEPVTVANGWLEIACDASGIHGYSVSGGPTDFSIDPDQDFTALESCLITVNAAQVADVDGSADYMLADVQFSFDTMASGSGYYGSVDTSNAQSLRTTLHDAIKDHTRYPYTSTSTDTWDILEFADQDPMNAGRIVDIYKNASYQKYGGGNTEYNREHSWPKSYGFTNDGSGNYPYTDTHMLFLSDSGYNSARGNKPYDDCASSCLIYQTDATNGTGGGVNDVNKASSNYWQTWDERKGDVARALMYMDVRYEGGVHGVTGAAEPDLVLTDDPNLIQSSSANESIAYMGLLSTILQWHQQDPVDEAERLRNEAVYSYQGNRNPFVDHPEWAACLFQNQCN